jgi:hypothetical protein
MRRVRAFLRKLAALAQEWVDPSAAKLPKLEEWDVDAVRAFVARPRPRPRPTNAQPAQEERTAATLFFVLWRHYASLY